MYKQHQTTGSVVMVPPVDFSFNPETAVDNEFQQNAGELSSEQLSAHAMSEFEGVVSSLQAACIEVILLNKSQSGKKLPDAVFANNWFSTRYDGKLFIYPMKTPNRQDEVQVEPLKDALCNAGYRVEQVVDLRQSSVSLTRQQPALEGTGSLVFQHEYGRVFATISERCDLQRLTEFCQQYDYQPNILKSEGADSKPVYHTNVLMSVGRRFAVVTREALVDNTQTRRSLKLLEESVDDLLTISADQMRQGFCANILQLTNRLRQDYIVMSSSAYKHFESKQIKQLEKHAELLVCHLPVIEAVGGGSLRCMLAENFLPEN